MATLGADTKGPGLDTVTLLFTVQRICADPAKPAASVAVTVAVVDVGNAGTPEIAPVVALMLRPEGRPEADQV
jgi:hypothetical protein